MSQPQKLRNFPPLKPRLLPTVRQEDKWRPVELWILLVKSFCLFYPFASALKKMGKKDKGGSHMGCMHSALWAQCKFLWFSTLALWRNYPIDNIKYWNDFWEQPQKRYSHVPFSPFPDEQLSLYEALKLYLYMLFQAWTSSGFLLWWWIITVQAVLWQIFQFLFPFIWK